MQAITILDEGYKLLSSSLHVFLQPLITSSLVSQDIHLSTLFSNTICLCSSLEVTGEVSHPYKPTGKMICFVYSNFYGFRKMTKRQKVLEQWYAALSEFKLLLISS
jgi:hypothetical protein